jgi:flagellar protein FlbD
VITLTKLNGEVLHLNPFQVESVDANPDTRVTMMNGRQIYVRESCADVLAAQLAWFRSIHAPPRAEETH